jgi:hypothetical protein
MKIEMKKIPVKELVEGYIDNNESGVTGFGGKLDIRPPFQREFVYKDRERDAVIDTLTKGYPLNVMYWAVRDGGGFEVIDGQQRTISICRYVTGDFSIGGLGFYNLQDDQRQQILDYELMVYFCEGTPSEKLGWFQTINIAGVELSNQELRNAVYAGSWTADAKRYFSKPGCAGASLSADYVRVDTNRQELLERAIEWHAQKEGMGSIEDYMAKHQHDANANALWLYFQAVIAWVKATFPVRRKEMRSVDWGGLYHKFGDSKPLDAKKLEARVAGLMQDEDVERKSGIYPYVLNGDERHLSIRAFSNGMKREAYERQKGICSVCGKRFEFEEMEGDHITPWKEGGKTVPENCQMLCKEDNRRKSSK